MRPPCLLQVLFEHRSAHRQQRIPSGGVVRSQGHQQRQRHDAREGRRLGPGAAIAVSPDVCRSGDRRSGVLRSGDDVTRPARSDTPAAAGTPRWWYYVARLKIEDRRVTEVEEIAYEREPNAFGADPANLTLADRIFDTLLPESERSTRAQLFDIANKYFDAVAQRINYRDVPWHPECQRIELGVFTVNAPRTAGSCGGEFQVPSVKWNVENQRFYIADVERGVVLAVGNFMTPPEYPTNNGSVVTEVFKVQDGMIRHIHAFFRGNGQPKSGWGSGPGS